MNKYLIQGSYTIDGIRGLIKEGGTSRKNIVEELVSNLGGSIECFYYCMGTNDFVIICSLPNRKTALALSLSVKATGGVTLSLSELIDTPEIDEAAKIRVRYRAPGK